MHCEENETNLCKLVICVGSKVEREVGRSVKIVVRCSIYLFFYLFFSWGGGYIMITEKFIVSDLSRDT